jgi:hypothetical protein
VPSWPGKRRWKPVARSPSRSPEKELAAELWRVRGSLDLMALLDPQTLKMFGIDLPDLNKLRSNVNRQLSKLRV